ncbi:hypothetical protein NKG05_09615 [Oerskovia sp. M15]
MSLTLPDQPGSLSSDGRIHVVTVAHDGTPAEHAPLVVEAAEGVSVAAGAALDATLATVTGGRASAERRCGQRSRGETAATSPSGRSSPLTPR